MWAEVQAREKNDRGEVRMGAARERGGGYAVSGRRVRTRSRRRLLAQIVAKQSVSVVFGSRCRNGEGFGD